MARAPQPSRSFKRSGAEHSIITDDSGKHVSGQMVECSVCDATIRLQTNNFHHRMPDVVVEKQFKRKGWTKKRNDWLCPIHSRRERHVMDVSPVTREVLAHIDNIVELAQVAPPQPVIPKETEPMPIATTPAPLKSFADLASASLERMTSSDRRRIFRAIDENWDDQRGRYVGSMGDQGIATQLNVARAWVQHIREESFGSAADNEEISDLRDELEALERRLAPYSEDALRIASAMEKLHADVRGLLRRLEVIEKNVGVRR